MSRLRFITEFKSDNNSVSVYYCPYDSEYRCKLYKGNEHRPGADYFTDDRDDAMQTARQMLDEAKEKEKQEFENKGIFDPEYSGILRKAFKP